MSKTLFSKKKKKLL